MEILWWIIMPQEAYVEMILNTKSPLVKLLQFVYSMENRNEYVFLKSCCIRVIIAQRVANNNDNKQVLDHP